MKRAIFLAMAALLAMLILVPMAMAQDTTMMMMETTMVSGGEAGGIPESGGPAILLPAAALLLGSGILTYAILRRSVLIKHFLFGGPGRPRAAPSGAGGEPALPWLSALRSPGSRRPLSCG
jgi:hypothetical protein